MINAIDTGLIRSKDLFNKSEVLANHTKDLFMDLKERASFIISDIIKKNKLSNAKLAEQLGWNKGTINNYRRKVSSPSGDFIESFCKEFSVNPEWFITGKGDPYGGGYRQMQLSAVDKALENLFKILPRPEKPAWDSEIERLNFIHEFLNDLELKIRRKGYRINTDDLVFVVHILHQYIRKGKQT